MAVESLFVSSVQKELAEERRAIRAFVEGDALLRRFFRVFLFEDLPAADRHPDDVYLDEVDRCAVYVGIFGREYGSEDADGVSATEREFDRATLAGKPRLIYVKNLAGGDRHPSMEALVGRVGSQLIRKRFGSVAELTTALYSSLVGHLVATGRIQDRPFDAAACPGATMADVSDERVRWFVGRARTERRFALEADASKADVLTHLDLLDGGVPTRAAILLFGVKPQRFLPSSELKCVHFHGTEVRKPIPSHHAYKGTAFDLVDQAVDFVLSKIARRVGTREESTDVPIDYELPPDAVREAIVNAVAHRDYASNASVQVALFSDRLEVWNPGELPPALTLAGRRRPHASFPRNPLIAEPLFLARYIEKLGTGTLDMIAGLREAGLREPEFRQEGGTFMQVLRRPEEAVEGAARSESRSESGSEWRSESRSGSAAVSQQSWWRGAGGWPINWTPETVPDRVMAAIADGPRSRAELARALGHRSVSGALRKALEALQELGFVELTVPEKPGSRLQRYRAVKRPEPSRR